MQGHSSYHITLAISIECLPLQAPRVYLVSVWTFTAHALTRHVVGSIVLDISVSMVTVHAIIPGTTVVRTTVLLSKSASAVSFVSDARSNSSLVVTTTHSSLILGVRLIVVESCEVMIVMVAEAALVVACASLVVPEAGSVVVTKARCCILSEACVGV